MSTATSTTDPQDSPSADLPTYPTLRGGRNVKLDVICDNSSSDNPNSCCIKTPVLVSGLHPTVFSMQSDSRRLRPWAGSKSRDRGALADSERSRSSAISSSDVPSVSVCV